MTAETHCFLFDRQNGKFIREIAQEGEGTLFLQKENDEVIMGQGTSPMT